MGHFIGFLIEALEMSQGSYPHFTDEEEKKTKLGIKKMKGFFP